MSTERSLVTDEIRALVGARGPVRSSPDEVSTSEIRRFAQAIFDDTRLFYDDAAAKASRFGGRVAPGTFAMHSLRSNIPFVDDALRWAKKDDEMHRVAVTEGLPLPEEWKTPPLWGVADSAPYLHDGRAPTLEEAIRQHGGQAAETTTRFVSLPQSQQQQLVAFLKSLRAPAE